MLSSDNCGCHFFSVFELRFVCSSAGIFFFVKLYNIYHQLSQCCCLAWEMLVLCDARKNNYKSVYKCVCVCVERHRVMKLNKQMTCWMPVEIIFFFLTLLPCGIHLSRKRGENRKTQFKWELACYIYLSLYITINVHIYICIFVCNCYISCQNVDNCQFVAATTLKHPFLQPSSTW